MTDIFRSSICTAHLFSKRRQNAPPIAAFLSSAVASELLRSLVLVRLESVQVRTSRSASTLRRVSKNINI